MKLSKEQGLKENQAKSLENVAKTLYSLFKMVTKVKRIFPKSATACIVCKDFYKKEKMYYVTLQMTKLTSLAQGSPFAGNNYYANVCKHCCKNKKAVYNLLDEMVFVPTFVHELKTVTKGSMNDETALRLTKRLVSGVH